MGKIIAGRLHQRRAEQLKTDNSRWRDLRYAEASRTNGWERWETRVALLKDSIDEQISPFRGTLACIYLYISTRQPTIHRCVRLSILLDALSSPSLHSVENIFGRSQCLDISNIYLYTIHTCSIYSDYIVASILSWKIGFLCTIATVQKWKQWPRR